MSVNLRDPEIILETNRCYRCGRWWALERGHAGGCPKCADTRLDEEIARADKIERSNRSLRGALTKASKARS